MRLTNACSSLSADGPLSVHISAHVGSMVRLVCSASSRPDCDFYWNVNNQVLSTGPVLTFPALKPHEGNYTCVARNPVTDITLHQSTVIVVGEGATRAAPAASLSTRIVPHFSLNMVAFLFQGAVPCCRFRPTELCC